MFHRVYVWYATMEKKCARDAINCKLVSSQRIFLGSGMSWFFLVFSFLKWLHFGWKTRNKKHLPFFNIRNLTNKLNFTRRSISSMSYCRWCIIVELLYLQFIQNVKKCHTLSGFFIGWVFFFAFWEITLRKCILTPATLIITFKIIGTIYYKISCEIKLNYQKYPIKPYTCVRRVRNIFSIYLAFSCEHFWFPQPEMSWKYQRFGEMVKLINFENFTRSPKIGVELMFRNNQSNYKRLRNVTNLDDIQ